MGYKSQVKCCPTTGQWSCHTVHAQDTLVSLKDEMDRYILDFVNLNPGKNRLDVPCLDLLHYSQLSFLPNSDMDYVRESMESLRSGESLGVFNWNFPDLSELAFSLDSLTDSMSTAINSDEVEDALQRLGHRIEEPIEKART